MRCTYCNRPIYLARVVGWLPTDRKLGQACPVNFPGQCAPNRPDDDLPAAA